MYFSLFILMVSLRRTGLRISQILGRKRSVEEKWLHFRVEHKFSCLWEIFVFYFLVSICFVLFFKIFPRQVLAM